MQLMMSNDAEFETEMDVPDYKSLLLYSYSSSKIER